MKLKKVKIFGKYIFYYLSNDKYIGQRVALEKYEPYETKLILRQTKKGNTIIDVGANIGYYTVLLADKVGKSGKVYAFEPDKVNFEILKKNIEVNNLKNVIVVNAGVGSKNETKTLYKSEENLGDHKLYETHPPCGHPPLKKGGQNYSIKEFTKIVKLDDFIKEPIDLIKIDTQGWEPEVIEGAKKIISKNKPIMFLEYSPASYQIAKLDGQKMIKSLRKIYKNIWWIDEWLYIYKNLKQKEIDKICATNKTGYADLWMKKEASLNDKIGQIRNLRIKKLIKKSLGL